MSDFAYKVIDAFFWLSFQFSGFVIAALEGIRKIDASWLAKRK